MKRIYVVIEFNAFDAIPQGAFETEDAAYEAMAAWMGDNPSASWVVKSCTLNNN